MLSFELGDISGLCLSPIRHDQSVPLTDSTSEGGTPSAGGYPSFIPFLTGTLCRFPPPAGNASKRIDTTRQKSPSTTAKTSWVPSINSGYQTEGISGQTCEILLAAWRQNATSSYSSTWNIWHSWCTERVIVNPLSPSLNSILHFFTSQFHEGKEYRTINVYRSALSVVLPQLDCHMVGCHPLVYQLLKGVYHLRSPQPRYVQTWQVRTLVELIASLGPNN